MIQTGIVDKNYLINELSIQGTFNDKTYKEPTGKNKKPFSKCQRAGNVWLPRQDEFRNFCMLEETDNVCHKLEEVIKVC